MESENQIAEVSENEYIELDGVKRSHSMLLNYVIDGSQNATVGGDLNFQFCMLLIRKVQ